MTNYEKYKETIKACTKRYLQENQEYRLLHSAKQRAKRTGLEFSLGFSDIIIPTHCPYLGIPLTNTFGEGRIQTNASVDRIDSSKGYTPDNIQIISDLANRMKQEATKEQLLSFAKSVIAMYG